MKVEEAGSELQNKALDVLIAGDPNRDLVKEGPFSFFGKNGSRVDPTQSLAAAGVKEAFEMMLTHSEHSRKNAKAADLAEANKLLTLTKDAVCMKLAERLSALEAKVALMEPDYKAMPGMRAELLAVRADLDLARIENQSLKESLAAIEDRF